MIKWGILGAGNVAQRFIKSLQNSNRGQFYSIASKTEKNREKYKNTYPNIKIYNSYDELLNDENVDVVYIALRHNDHYPWAKAALKKHKAVLCEKPATLFYRETYDLCHTAKKNNTFFMEALKTPFIPLIDDIKELLNKGIIGDIKSIENKFCYKRDYSPTNYLFDDFQGGILNDVGSYTIFSILNYIHSPIIDIQSKVKYQYNVDIHDEITINFENKQSAFIEIAGDETKNPDMIITGNLGVLKASPFYRPKEAIIELNTGESYTISKPYIIDDFFSEIEEVHDCILDNKIESEKMSFQDSLNCIKVIENIRNSFIKEL